MSGDSENRILDAEGFDGEVKALIDACMEAPAVYARERAKVAVARLANHDEALRAALATADQRAADNFGIYVEATRERDEARAALVTAETERDAAARWENVAEWYCDSATDFSQRSEAALTELRETRDALMASRSDWMDRHARMKERAEAAEARVTALTEALQIVRALAVPMDPPADNPIPAPLSTVIVEIVDRALLVGEPDPETTT